MKKKKKKRVKKMKKYVSNSPPVNNVLTQLGNSKSYTFHSVMLLWFLSFLSHVFNFIEDLPEFERISSQRNVKSSSSLMFSDSASRLYDEEYTPVKSSDGSPYFRTVPQSSSEESLFRSRSQHQRSQNFQGSVNSNDSASHKGHKAHISLNAAISALLEEDEEEEESEEEEDCGDPQSEEKIKQSSALGDDQDRPVVERKRNDSLDEVVDLNCYPTEVSKWVILREQYLGHLHRLCRPEDVEQATQGNFLLIYICNFHVISHLLLIYICKLHWNLKKVLWKSNNCYTNSYRHYGKFPSGLWTTTSFRVILNLSRSILPEWRQIPTFYTGNLSIVGYNLIFDSIRSFCLTRWTGPLLASMKAISLSTFDYQRKN